MPTSANEHINLLWLKAFVLRVRLGSSTAAAQALNCPPDYVSKYLKALTTRLKVELFVSSHSSTLTRNGIFLFPIASRVVDLLDFAFVRLPIDSMSDDERWSDQINILKLSRGTPGNNHEKDADEQISDKLLIIPSSKNNTVRENQRILNETFDKLLNTDSIKSI